MSPDRENRASSSDERALKRLRLMSETELHKRIIEPLLRKMGNYVRYVHGPQEQGKDFVFIMRDGFGDSQLHACQVKNLRFSGEAGTGSNVARILDQILECSRLEVTNPETNLNERPKVVSLWTTHPIPQHALGRAGPLLQEIRDSGCKIIGPEKLLRFIERYLPEKYSSLACREDRMASKYLGRVERCTRIIGEVKGAISGCQGGGPGLDVRMRATFTSMSNVRHYEGRRIPGLSPTGARMLDNLLVKERNSILRLLDSKGVSLKCICWPKTDFLSPYYSEEQRGDRVRLLKRFLRASLRGAYIARRQVLCDRAAAYGNQIIIGRRVAILANPKSGGYGETSIFVERPVIDALIREYDILFNQILKANAKLRALKAGKERNTAMWRDLLSRLQSKDEEE